MKRLYKFRFVPLLFGIALTFISSTFMAGYSLPYLDPTPEMLENQMIQIRNAKIFIYIGIFIIVASIIFYIVMKILNRRMDGK